MSPPAPISPSTAVVPTSAAEATLSPGGMPWPASESEWRTRWLSIHRFGIPFMKQAYPDEPQGITANARAELWRCSLASDEMAMKALNKEISAPWYYSELGFVMAFLSTISSVITAFLCMIPANNAPATTGGIISSLAIFSTLATAWFVGIRFYRKSEARRGFLGDIEHQINKTNSHGRLANVVLRMKEQGIEPARELLAFTEVLRNVQTSSVPKVSIEDCVAVTNLADSMEKAVRTMRPGAALTLKGENSELIHRVAAALGCNDLDGLMDDITNPRNVAL